MPAQPRSLELVAAIGVGGGAAAIVPGGVALPLELSPQQATEPSDCTPQV